MMANGREVGLPRVGGIGRAISILRFSNAAARAGARRRDQLPEVVVHAVVVIKETVAGPQDRFGCLPDIDALGFGLRMERLQWCEQGKRNHGCGRTAKERNNVHGSNFLVDSCAGLGRLQESYTRQIWWLPCQNQQSLLGFFPVLRFPAWLCTVSPSAA